MQRQHKYSLFGNDVLALTDQQSGNMAREVVLMFLGSVMNGSYQCTNANSESIDRDAAHVVTKNHKIVQCCHGRDENLPRQYYRVQSHFLTELYVNAIGERIFSSRRIHIKSWSMSTVSGCQMMHDILITRINGK